MTTDDIAHVRRRRVIAIVSLLIASFCLGLLFAGIVWAVVPFDLVMIPAAWLIIIKGARVNA